MRTLLNNKGSWATLGQRYRAIRKEKKVSSPKLADRIKLIWGDRPMKPYDSSTILKRERGDLTISIPYATVFIEAMNLPKKEADDLMTLTELYQAEYNLWRLPKDRELGDWAGKIYHRVLNCNRYRSYSPTLVPFILQTPDYAKAILSKHPTADQKAFLEKRLNAAKSLRKDANRNIQLVIRETALYSPVGSFRIMIDQLKMLLELPASSPVEARILPSDEFVDAADCNINIYDSLFISTDTPHGGLYLGDMEALEACEAMFQDLFLASKDFAKSKTLIEKAIAYYESRQD